MMTPTRTLAAFASTLAYKHIPTVVREATKQYLLDTIGCGIYDRKLPGRRSLTALVWSREVVPRQRSGSRGFAAQPIPWHWGLG